MRKALREYQLDIKNKVYQEWSKYRNILMVLPTGAGKCHPRGTKILLYSGEIKNVEDIRVNDLLMGPDSKPRRVLSTCKGKEEMFTVKPIKGEEWGCNKSHVLSLRHTETKKIVNISVEEYLKKTKNFKHLHKLWRTGVDFKDELYSYEPYFIGLYLAEGCYSHPMITTPEPEIKGYLKKWANENDSLIRVEKGSGCDQIHFKSKDQKWNGNKVREIKRYCTSKDDRWIPKEYLTNSREVRLKILAGLLDGDGYLHNNCYEIVTKYHTLKDDILYLARSLGLHAQSKVKVSNYKGYAHHVIGISGDVDMIPCKVERKKAKPRKQIKNVLNTGFTLESKGEGEYYGFELDGDHLYLLGDFTVTHNTVTFCSIAIDYAVNRFDKYPTAIIVHRKELVQQISLTLAGEGIKHNIIAPRNVILQIIAAQRKVYRTQFYDYNSPITVVSVDTLNARAVRHEKWAKTIKFWIVDEAAHVLKDNKWGKALSLFTDSIGLGVTATPERLDRKGLGSHVDGVFDTMVEGPSVKWLIDNGYLCKWKAVVPPSDYEKFLKNPRDRDFTAKEMETAARESHIIGDVVSHYVKWALGKQAILFAPTISVGREMEEEFNDNGIPAKLLTGDTPPLERLQGLLDFQEKKLKVLLNVDLFDEGLDCLDEDTEILTPNGWKDMYTINNETHCYAWKDGRIKSLPIQRKVQRFRRSDEKMWTVTSQHTDIRVTENHNIVWKGKDYYTKDLRTEETFITPAKEMHRYTRPFNLPLCGEMNFKGLELSNDEIELLGWGLTDSHLREGSLTLYQSKPKYVKEIRDLLNRLDYSFKETIRTPEQFKGYGATMNAHRFYIHTSDRWKEIRHLFNKNDLHGDLHFMTRCQFKLLWDTMMKANGSKTANKNGKLCTIRRNHADTFMHMAVLRGYSMMYGTYKSKSGSTVYNIGIKDKKYIQLTQRDKRGAKFKLTTPSKPEQVWCVTNEWGTLITRRNGKIVVSGNCPGIEVVIHARPTMSKGKYKQMNGRGLRPASNKSHLLIIDHVGNIARHGRPDREEKWTLDRVATRRKTKQMLRFCSNPMCAAPYERELKECPFCGTPAIKVPGGEGGARVPPEMVDGDLVLMDPDTLSELERATILETPESIGERVARAAGTPAGIRAMRNQELRIETQNKLKHKIAEWAGELTYRKLEDREIHKLFYLSFGKTISEALAEPTREMEGTIDELSK